MHAQHQKGIPPAIPKGPTDDHETYTMRKREKIKKVFFFFHYYSLLCLLPLQRNSHRTSAILSPLSSSSATANPSTIHKTFTLTHPSTGKSKFKTYRRYALTL